MGNYLGWTWKIHVLFYIKIKQAWHFEPVRCASSALIHPQTFKEMSLLIFTQWPHDVRPYLWQPMHQEFSAVRKAICVYFPLRAALPSLPCSHLSSSRIHFTLNISIIHVGKLKQADLTNEQQITMCSKYEFALSIHMFTKPHWGVLIHTWSNCMQKYIWRKKKLCWS